VTQDKNKDKDEGEDEDEDEGKRPLPSDIDASVTALNDVRVYDNLESPPFPYERKHAISYLKSSYADTRQILEQYQKRQDQKSESEWIDGCPFRDIRDTSLPSSSSSSSSSSPSVVNAEKSHDKQEISKSEIEIGKIDSALKIGDIMINRYPFYELPLGSEQRQKAREYNDSLPAGHEGLILGTGFWLLPAYHRKGIMSGVLNSLIHDWAIPKMNMYVLKGSAFVGNEGSVGVFRKCGFVVEGIIEKGSAELPSTRPGGGGRRDIYVLKWERERK